MELFNNHHALQRPAAPDPDPAAQRKRRQEQLAATVNELGLVESPVRGRKRFQIRSTPEQIRKLTRDIEESARQENDPNDRKLIREFTKDLSEAQSKWNSEHVGLMAPSGDALLHPAAPLLWDFSTQGCPVDAGDEWTPEQWEAAIRKGAHPSALEPDAAAALRQETLEKVDQGFCRLVQWDDIKDDPPKNLKISPIAAIPHNSRLFRMILDLSHGVRIRGKRMPSVNESTNPSVAPKESMAELGSVLPRIIYALATAPELLGPILFSKLDIKDGYWRMVVSHDDEWHFAYVLPALTPGEPITLVIPSALQMGWTDSPAYFCAASETARDVAEYKAALPKEALPPHPLEQYVLPDDWSIGDLSDSSSDDSSDASLLEPLDDFFEEEEPQPAPSNPPPLQPQASAAPPKPAAPPAAPPASDPPATIGPQPDSWEEKFLTLIECYVDDFINVAQTTEVNELRHRSRALLHAIHEIFPPPSVTGHDGEDPISMKKLLQGDGVWSVRKEILGWLFDGLNRCMQLPTKKIISIRSELKQVSRLTTVPRKRLEKLRGKLRHACLGLPIGRSLIGPIDNALLDGTKSQVPIRGNPLLLQVLADFRLLLTVMRRRPTLCKELVPAAPNYVAYCDASKLGAGGVWMSGTTALPPIVWRLEFPKDIQDRVVSYENTKGDITNSDLEMAAVLLSFLVLEHIVLLHLVHLATWSDNTPTVSWATKMSSSRSMVAARLVRALQTRMFVNTTSPLSTWSIQGKKNVMADFSSRTFNRSADNGATFTISDAEFLQLFASKFPHPQSDSWRLFRFSNKLSSLVFSELRRKTSTLASWLRIPKKGSSIGTIGSTSSAPSITWTPCSPTVRPAPPSTTPSESTSYVPSLDGSGKASTPETSPPSGLRPYKSRFVPSARRSNWRENPTRPTDPQTDIGSRSNA